MPNAPADVIANIKSTAASLRACVLAHTAGSDYQAAMGLSIFAPNSATVYGSNRPDYVRLQFSTYTGWGAILDVLYGFQGEGVRFLSNATPRPATVAGTDDAEFMVSLRGFSIDDNTRDRIEKAVRRTVLAKLAEVDALGDVSVVPASTFLNAIGVRSVFGRPRLGLVVRSNLMPGEDPLGNGPATTSQPQAPLVAHPGDNP